MKRQSLEKRPVFSTSTVMDAIASDLSTIKREDNLSDKDIGRILGKSDEQARKYLFGGAEMGVVAYAAGKREWGKRFTRRLDDLCRDSRPGNGNDHSALTALAEAMAKLSKALEDGDVTSDEVRKDRAAYETARDQLDVLLGKIRLVA